MVSKRDKDSKHVERPPNEIGEINAGRIHDCFLDHLNLTSVPLADGSSFRGWYLLRNGVSFGFYAGLSWWSEGETGGEEGWSEDDESGGLDEDLLGDLWRFVPRGSSILPG